MTERSSADTVEGTPRVFLRVEGAVLLALSMFIYDRFGESWILFVLLLLAPDAGLAGYLGGPAVGAATYNATHTYLGPGILLAAGIGNDSAVASSIALVWFAHIGLDRALGYGLKYGDDFKHTHLGWIGRR